MRRSLRAQALDDAFAVTTRVGLNCFFVEGQQTAVAHHDAAFDDHGLDVARFGRVNQIRIDIVERCLIQGVEVDDDEIGALPLLDRSNFLLEMQRARAANRGHLKSLRRVHNFGILAK